MPGKDSIFRLIVSLLICILPLCSTTIVSAESIRSTYTVTNTDNMGPGSLRQAIIDSNAHVGADTIVFDIPDTDSAYQPTRDEYYILIAEGFELTDTHGVTIDATTQPEKWADEIPEIWIAIASVDEAVFSITEDSKGNIIKGMMLQGSSGIANTIAIDGDINVIEENYIGSLGGGDGISLSYLSSSNYIDDNYIFNQTLNGIRLAGSTYNVITNNKIGLVPTWMSGDANGHHGILCAQCSNNQILNNHISGNGMNGIYMSTAGGNLVEGNLIGLNVDGDLANSNGDHGIRMSDHCVGNDVFENWISGNGKDGIHLDGEYNTNNHIELNAIGYGLDSSLIPNTQHGIGIYDGANGNYVGKFGDPDRGNFIGGNGWSGVVIVNSLTGLNYLYGNHMLYNQWYGVHVVNSPNNYIGFNTIGHNGVEGTHEGVRIEGVNAVGNAITKNSIYANTGLGINLVDGGNTELPEPLLYSATFSSVTGTSCPNCTIQIYSDQDYEGEYYEVTVVADPTGFFTYSSPGPLFHGPNITAIAFSGNNTSEFALPRVGIQQTTYLPVILK